MPKNSVQQNGFLGGGGKVVGGSISAKIYAGASKPSGGKKSATMGGRTKPTAMPGNPE